MLNSQFKIFLFSLGIIVSSKADQLLFQEFSQKLLSLQQQCHEKAETLRMDCELLEEQKQQIAQIISHENLSSHVAVQELIADIAQTTCKMPTFTEPIISSIRDNITRLLNVLLYATLKSARIIHPADDPHIAEYQRIFNIVADITQQFIDLPLITEYTEKKGARCRIADLIWQFGQLCPASKKLIKNSRG